MISNYTKQIEKCRGKNPSTILEDETENTVNSRSEGVCLCPLRRKHLVLRQVGNMKNIGKYNFIFKIYGRIVFNIHILEQVNESINNSLWS